jgi:hypothetical protein
MAFAQDGFVGDEFDESRWLGTFRRLFGGAGSFVPGLVVTARLGWCAPPSIVRTSTGPWRVRTVWMRPASAVLLAGRLGMPARSNPSRIRAWLTGTEVPSRPTTKSGRRPGPRPFASLRLSTDRTTPLPVPMMSLAASAARTALIAAPAPPSTNGTTAAAVFSTRPPASTAHELRPHGFLLAFPPCLR